MVVFTCQKCNSTLKKKAVEKHFSCRPLVLTCIDCLKDFYGKDYDNHKSCISESEKYGGSKVVVKQTGVKQEKWIETVTEVLAKLSEDNKYEKICMAMKDNSNIPRIRNKFHNYLKSLCPRMYSTNLADEIFNQFEQTKKRLEDINLKKGSHNGKNGENSLKDSSVEDPCVKKNVPEDDKDLAIKESGDEQNEETTENVDESKDEKPTLSKKEKKKLKKQQKYLAELAEIETVKPEVDENENDEGMKTKKKKKKKDRPEVVELVATNGKRKQDEQTAEDISGKKIKLNDTLLDEEEVPATEPKRKFKWGNVITEILQKAPNNELSLKKLRKKVLSEYQALQGDGEPYEKVISKFNKKVNCTEGVKIVKDKAQLLAN